MLAALPRDPQKTGNQIQKPTPERITGVNVLHRTALRDGFPTRSIAQLIAGDLPTPPSS